MFLAAAEQCVQSNWPGAVVDVALIIGVTLVVIAVIRDI